MNVSNPSSSPRPQEGSVQGSSERALPPPTFTWIDKVIGIATAVILMLGIALGNILISLPFVALGAGYLLIKGLLPSREEPPPSAPVGDSLSVDDKTHRRVETVVIDLNESVASSHSLLGRSVDFGSPSDPNVSMDRVLASLPPAPPSPIRTEETPSPLTQPTPPSSEAAAAKGPFLLPAYNPLPTTPEPPEQSAPSRIPPPPAPLPPSRIPTSRQGQQLRLLSAAPPPSQQRRASTPAPRRAPAPSAPYRSVTKPTVELRTSAPPLPAKPPKAKPLKK